MNMICRQGSLIATKHNFVLCKDKIHQTPKEVSFTCATMAATVVLLKPPLPWKVTSFRECRHSLKRCHLHWKKKILFELYKVNHATMEKNHAMKKERHKELLDDDFDDYDNDHYYERHFLYLYTITWYFL